MSLKSLVNASALGLALGGAVFGGSRIAGRFAESDILFSSVAYAPCSALAEEKYAAENEAGKARYSLQSVPTREAEKTTQLTHDIAAYTRQSVDADSAYTACLQRPAVKELLDAKNFDTDNSFMLYAGLFGVSCVASGFLLSDLRGGKK